MLSVGSLYDGQGVGTRETAVVASPWVLKFRLTYSSLTFDPRKWKAALVQYMLRLGNDLKLHEFH